MITTSEVLLLIADADWRPFDQVDYDAWAGVISENPMIAEDDELGLIYILDGVRLTVIDEEGVEVMTELNKVVTMVTNQGVLMMVD